MIDTYYTFIIFGYRVDELSKWAKVPVVAMCDKCCEYRTVRYDSYTDLCSPCSHKEMVRNEEWNHNISVGLMGHVVTEETRRNISNGSKDRKMPPRTDEHRRNLSESGKRRPPRSQEWSGKISNAMMGHLVTEEQRRKQSATMQGIPYEEWDGFVRYGEYCEKFDEACKERIREKYGRMCFLCSKNESDETRKLSVHHVDMNKEQGCNGVLWKLVPLCRRCHARSHSKMWKTRIEYLLEI